MKTRMSIILAAITMILLISAPAFCEENSTMDVTGEWYVGTFTSYNNRQTAELDGEGRYHLHSSEGEIIVDQDGEALFGDEEFEFQILQSEETIFFFQRQSGAFLIIPLADEDNEISMEYQLFEFSDMESYLMLDGRIFIHSGDGGSYEEGDSLEYYIHDGKFYYIENTTYMSGKMQGDPDTMFRVDYDSNLVSHLFVNMEALE